MTDDIQKALQSIVLFSKLPPAALKKLAQFALIRTVHKGETIFCQGEPSPYCFGLLSGQVIIQRVPKDRRFPPKVLSVLGPGSHFGESSFFEESPRAAMASAIQDGKLVAILGTKLREWLKKEPDLGQEVLLGMLEKSLERLEQTSVDLAVIYGVARLLGSQNSFPSALAAALDFVKNSLQGIDDIVFYERSAYWDEFEPVPTGAGSAERRVLPATHPLVAEARNAEGAIVLASPQQRESLAELKGPGDGHAAVALVPLVDYDAGNKPLEGFLLLVSRNDPGIFSPNTLLLLSAISNQLGEALARHRRLDDAQAQQRLKESRSSFTP